MARYIVCYDISDGDLRDRVPDLLRDGYDANPVQESVFEVSLNRTHRDELIADLTGAMDPDKDRLAVYRLCDTCKAASFVFGKPPGN